MGVGNGDFERTYGAGADFDRIIDENNSEYFRDERQKKLKIRKKNSFFSRCFGLGES